MRIIYFTPSIIWGLFIFFVISLPAGSIPSFNFFNIQHLDLLVHFLLFCGFGITVSYGFLMPLALKKVFKPHGLFWALLIGIILSFATEAFQFHFVQTRTGDVKDFSANIFGTIFGVLLAGVIYWAALKKNSNADVLRIAKKLRILAPQNQNLQFKDQNQQIYHGNKKNTKS